jgi:hypothetical protein
MRREISKPSRLSAPPIAARRRPLIQINARGRRHLYPFRREMREAVITQDFDGDKWAEVAAECRRLADLAAIDWLRAELLRSARFYDNLSAGFGRDNLRVARPGADRRAAG